MVDPLSQKSKIFASTPKGSAKRPRNDWQNFHKKAVQIGSAPLLLFIINRRSWLRR